MKSQLIGVDIGTTGVKSVLIDNSGTILTDATVPHDLHAPQVGWAEEHPADWIAGAIGSLRAITGHPSFDPQSLAGIGVSGMVPAMVMLDKYRSARAAIDPAKRRSGVCRSRRAPHRSRSGEPVCANRRIHESPAHRVPVCVGCNDMNPKRGLERRPCSVLMTMSPHT